MEENPSKELVKAETSLAITVKDLQPIDKSDPDFPSGQTSVTLNREYPLNVLPERRQASVLGWKVDVLRNVNELTGIFITLPSICAGTVGCPFGKICSVSNRDQFIGKSCPLEVLEIYKQFSGYVKDLKIQPEDFTDLQMVSDLVRQHIVLWRSDMYMKLEPEVINEVKVVRQSTGTPYYQKIINPHRINQAEARKAIHAIYKQLQASRADKATLANSAVNAAAIFTDILSSKK